MRKFLFFASIFLYTCDIPTFEVDNPYDPQNPSYVAPSVTINSGPIENEIITTDNVAFTWIGNNETMTFRYFLDGNLKQDWDDISSVLIQYLDEGAHKFGVQGRYPTEDVSDTVFVNFTVNAVLGPSLLFYPRKHDAVIGEEVTFQIFAEEVIDLSAAEFTINYNTTLINIESITQGDLFKTANQSIFYVDQDPLQDSFTVLTAILDGISPSVSGTGVLAEIVVKINSQGTSNITFSGANKFRGPNNTAIEIREKIGGIVIAK